MGPVSAAAAETGLDTAFNFVAQHGALMVGSIALGLVVGIDPLYTAHTVIENVLSPV